MKFKILFGTVLGLALQSSAFADVLCTNSEGAITVRPRCHRAETRLNLESLQGQPGPQGPAGSINFSTCHAGITHSIPPILGIPGVREAYCDSSFEFMQSYSIDPQGLVIIGSQLITHPVGQNNFVATGVTASAQNGIPAISIVCCRR